MSILIISKKNNQTLWKQTLIDLMPEVDVCIYPNKVNADGVEMILAWHPPIGIFKKYPNLKVIASTGAGVDHILKDPDIPNHVIVTRVVDNRLTSDMTAYLEAQVACHLKNISTYKLQQFNHQWQPHSYKRAEEVNIGIMGMGQLGMNAALKFVAQGYHVVGWAQSPKNIVGVDVFYGKEQLNDFLARTNILICLLPLTTDTANILSKKTFDKLPRGAFVINVARGEHLVEEDLLNSLDSGQLIGACLDVFPKEPLPVKHPFWAQPKILITPHVASITNVSSVAPQIIENYKRLIANKPLLNTISLDKGY